MKPGAIATLATESSFDDLELFLKTLQLWNEEELPDIYLFCDNQVLNKLAQISYKGTIHTNTRLESYSGLVRSQMERLRGKTYSSLWFDFMAEKINLLSWALSSLPPGKKASGVLFLDADICFLGQLSDINPSAKIAVSQHFIRKSDEDRFGKFNGGFFWTNTEDSLIAWRTACYDSRFFEQSAIEDVVASFIPSEVQEMTANHNYGWWRLLQGSESYETLARQWSVGTPTSNHCGILLNSSPLYSIHTHFTSRSDMSTTLFNSFVYKNLKNIPASPKNQKLINLILKKAPWLVKL